MMRNIKLLIEYDGTNYIGWQIQLKSQGKSIQGVLQEKLEKIVCHKVKLAGAGRTDAGVHAKGQVANFFTESKIPVNRIPLALSSMLPSDIVVKGAWEVSHDFHALSSAVEKTYRYTILQSPINSAFEWRYCYHVRYVLDIDNMKKAVEYLIGTYDYSSFCSSGTTVKEFTRTVKEGKLYQEGNLLHFEITGDGFLYNMVRIIVGTLIEIGRGRWAPEYMAKIIAAKNRNMAGPTAPPQGLVMLNVIY